MDRADIGMPFWGRVYGSNATAKGAVEDAHGEQWHG